MASEKDIRYFFRHSREKGNPGSKIVIPIVLDRYFTFRFLFSWKSEK